MKLMGVLYFQHKKQIPIYKIRRDNMFKKFWVLFVLILLVAGCNSEGIKENINESNQNEKNDELIIKTKLTNKEEKAGYLIYFMHVGARNEKPGEANQSRLGPFETDENGECIIDLKLNYENDVGTYLNSDGNMEKNKLEMFIVTQEDIYIRNPLNEKTIVEFIPNENEEDYYEYPYYSKEKEIEVSFTDKYPDGVLSLTFQDSIFVIKLEFDGEPPEKSFETSIFWNDPSMPDGIGITCVGRICREFQYWDTPFFKADNLESKTGTIIIKDLDTNNDINYEGYPKTVSFDKDGNPIGDKIVRIKIK